MRMSVVVVLAALPLVSCASLSEDQCRAGDWRGIGVTDGAAGRSTSYISRHREACGKIGIVPDTTAWLAGRSEGLLRYCTPANAYKVGRSGNTLSPVCGDPQRAVLTRANIIGRQYHELTRQIGELRSQADDLRERIGELEGEDEFRERDRLRRDRRRIENRIQDLEFERIRYSALIE